MGIGLGGGIKCVVRDLKMRRPSSLSRRKEESSICYLSGRCVFCREEDKLARLPLYKGVEVFFFEIEKR